MKKKYFQLLVGVASSLVFVFAVFGVVTSSVDAATITEDTLWGKGGATPVDVKGKLGLGEKDPRVIIANVIQVILGFLGIVAVVMIVLAGFKWMTAGGNQTGVDEARKLLMSAVIGLVIILGAYGIANFVINALMGATGTP